MVNEEGLRHYLDASNLSLEKISILLGIDRSTLYRKIQNKGKSFTVEEMQKLVDILEIPKDKASAIFFNR